MQIVIIIILALLCAALIGYLAALKVGMRRAEKQIAEQLENRSTVRVSAPFLGTAEERLLQTVNKLLELRMEEGVSFRRKEQDLRRQIANYPMTCARR